MGKFKRNKLVTAILEVLMLCTMLGCGGTKGTGRQFADNRNDMVYEWTNIWIDGVQGYGRIGAVNGDKVCIIADEYLEEEDASGENGKRIKKITRMYSCDTDWENLREIPSGLAESESFAKCVMDGSGNIISMIYNQTKEAYELVKIDTEGRELARKSMEGELDVYGMSPMVSGLIGNLIISDGQVVAVLDENLEWMGSVDVGDAEVEELILGRDGQIFCVQVSKNGRLTVSVLNVDKIAWEDSYEIKEREGAAFGLDWMRGTGEYDFYYQDDAGIYGYQTKNKKSVKIMDYTASGMTAERLGTFRSMEDGTFLGITGEARENMVGISVYSKVDPALLADKKTMTLGLFGVDESVQKAVVDFNRQNKEYQIEIRDYLMEEDPFTKINTDIAAGNAPDIWEITFLQADAYIAKGLLEDLTPYFEQDEEIDTADIFPSVVEALSKDGKIYSVASNFNIFSMAARKKDVGEREGWNFQEMKKAVEAREEGTKLFYFDSKSDILYSLLDMGVFDFVDWDTGECHFDSQEFREILEFCEEEGSDRQVEWNGEISDMLEAYREGSVLFREGAVDLNMILINNSIMGDEVVYVGYPNRTREGSYFQFQNQLAIYAKSEKKDAAWQFIRTFMTKEYQGLEMGISEVPTRQDCYELAVEAKMAQETYTNRLGRVISPGENRIDYEDIHIEGGTLTQSDADCFTDLIRRTVKCAGYGNQVMVDIIQEEAAYYFAGERSLDDTIEIIQRRVEIYISENR